MSETIRFRVMPGIGDGKREETGSIVQFLTYLFPLQYFPPLVLLNELLSIGLCDAGSSSGAEWEPFELTLAEYEAVVAQLSKKPLEYQVIKPPSWVGSWLDWSCYQMELNAGIPAQEHATLVFNTRTACANHLKAEASGDPAEMKSTRSIWTTAETELSDFLKTHHEKYRRKKRS